MQSVPAVSRLLVVVFSLLACMPLAAAAPTPADLAAATYHGIHPEPVRLVDGSWQGAPYVAGGASRPALTLVPGLDLAGDLDGDGQPEAVALLAATTGGSGSFYHLAVMARRDGGLVQRALAPLGDRVQVRRAAALAGGFELEVVEAGPGDAACCPGQRVLRRWALAGKTLRELPPAPLGRLGTDALGGITWQLQALASGLPLPPGNGVVVTFSADEVSGTAGCNSFFGGVRAGDRPGEVRIGPLMKTTTACADYADALEATFLARLVDVERFTFLGTRLALSYRNGQAFDLLLFSQLE